MMAAALLEWLKAGVLVVAAVNVVLLFLVLATLVVSGVRGWLSTRRVRRLLERQRSEWLRAGADKPRSGKG